MKIFVNNKEAVLKEGTSIDYIAENRLFTGADSYTLSITFPLRGCPQNLEIFGHINRKDTNLSTLLLSCEMHDLNFHRYGCISIVEISEVEVKTQFLEGRSIKNFKTNLDEVYINEMELDELHVEAFGNASDYLMGYIQQKNTPGKYKGFVCLPWVNNTSGNIQNPMRYIEASESFCYTDCGPGEYAMVVAQPFLIEVIKNVLGNCGYTADLRTLESSVYAGMVVCNALPYAWGKAGMQYILPHWSVTEFLEEIENFLFGEFIFDEQRQKVSFQFHQSYFGSMQVTELLNVTDSHTIEVSDEEDVKNTFIDQQNVNYAECSHRMWKFQSCEWLKKQTGGYIYNNIAAMKNKLDSYLVCEGAMTHHYYGSWHYCRQEDTYFVLECVRSTFIGGVQKYYMRYQPLNRFGKKIVDTREDAQCTELKIVPAWIDFTDNTNGDLIFIECGELGYEEEGSASQTKIVNILTAGEQEDKTEAFFDRLFIAFYDGEYMRLAPQMPRPYLDPIEITPDNEYFANVNSMRLTSNKAPMARQTHYKVDAAKKFTFTFLADEVPDVQNIFLIHGKKYLAEKITATISEDGLSQLMKMVAYRLLE